MEISDVKFGDDYPVRLMGVLNLGPESFYKGSVVTNHRAAEKIAVDMVESGSSFLDLGAVSTAPGVGEISENEEMARLKPILKAVLDSVDVPLSIDTFRSKIADMALNMGATIINDVSSFQIDKNMINVLKDHDAPSIIMATNRIIGDPLTVEETISSLIKCIETSEKLGYEREKIIIDPAIGRWVPKKTYKYNIDLIKNIDQFSKLNRPILVGISRKSFIHEILGRPEPNDRLFGTLSATAVAIINGAHIVRTHDISETFDVVRIAELLK
jgi:dihydropteroate synthase